MSEILTHQNAGVLTITFNRPTRKNAITATMYQTLTKALTDAATDPTLRVVLLQGTDTLFSAGNDLDDFITHPPTDLQAPVWQFLHTLSAFPKPIVAAVCGFAVGIGTTMLLHCDLVYAATDARFSVPFVNLGLCPEGACSLLLPKALAAEALLTGDPFDAATALQAGLVNRVLPAPEVLGWALAQAQKIAQKPSEAVMQTKRLLKSPMLAAVHAHIDEEALTFASLLQGEAAQDAIAAFINKQKPH